MVRPPFSTGGRPLTIVSSVWSLGVYEINEMGEVRAGKSNLSTTTYKQQNDCRAV